MIYKDVKVYICIGFLIGNSFYLAFGIKYCQSHHSLIHASIQFHLGMKFGTPFRTYIFRSNKCSPVIYLDIAC